MRILYSEKLYFKNEAEIKTFLEKKNPGSLLPLDLPCKKY